MEDNYATYVIVTLIFGTLLGVAIGGALFTGKEARSNNSITPDYRITITEGVADTTFIYTAN
jgi:hypothetical protein